jgi:hypothetical protein
MTPEQIEKFTADIDTSPAVELDYWGRVMVTIQLPGGITLGLRASEIAAAVAPRSYERSLGMYRNDCERKNTGELV